MRDGATADGDPLMGEGPRAALEEACRILPTLGVLRRFVNAVHDLFSPATTTDEQAMSKRRAILDDPEFSAAAFLNPARELVADEDLFVRLTRYLNFENAEKTSNHVERENREFRKRQKSHYRMRSLPSLCALLDLLLTRRPVPSSPRRLRRKEPPDAGAKEEVKHAA